MSALNYSYVSSQYSQVNASSAVYLQSLKLVNMLYNTAIEKISISRVCLQSGNVVDKCKYLNQALKIIDALQLNLDKKQGGEIAQNLDRLYEYMYMRLVHANVNNDLAVMDEVSGMLNKLAAAWREIESDDLQAQSMAVGSLSPSLDATA
jgi:flagellar secretion chaperone FliS